LIARESGRPLGILPQQIAVAVIAAAELELGVLRARDGATRATRLATLAQVRSTYPLLAVDEAVATHFARLAAEELEAGREAGQ
jgi:predicted nucleic acid-binding protein